MVRKKKSDARRPWTDIEVKVLRKFYPTTPTAAIAAALNRPITQVYGAAMKRGLKKTDAYLASPDSGRLMDGSVGMAGRFQKGIKPWNTGTKGVSGQHPNCRKSQFKKGNRTGAANRNYVPIGTLKLSKDGYLERKVTDDPNLVPARRWVGVHRLVWEREHGPIPIGHVVAFKPGMRTAVEEEITIDRFVCLTQAENMARNTIHNYPKPIKDAMRARGVLNRRINRIEKEASDEQKHQ